MSASASRTIYRKDYRKPDYEIGQIDLEFDLDPDETRVASCMTLTRRKGSKASEIFLHGNGLRLAQLRMNGEALDSSAYTLEGGDLRIFNAPGEVVLEIVTLIRPAENTSLMGLYVSNGNFFTQCEAEGFRKITFFPDRPDVMAKFTVTLRANQKHYPVLLSNGNLIEEGKLNGGRHYAKWEDPFRKPAYLFALVAGKLVCQEEKFRLMSGREALLQVWVEKGNLDKTQHAMDSLKHSIRWDESRYGLELDLDRYMIVAVGDFNMGAMENKGLNIFNTKYVLANPRIATDMDYGNIEAIVAHEYFHNWTGNRVTCQDWFQLSLKEGLTVFRDQEFSADMAGTSSGRAVKRIEDVRRLRQFQFPEDAGPMAHPVRPDSYAEINNFYTVTVYEKGAEVVRMYQTMLGVDGFRKGMDLYFERHDGQAVTCDDFRAAMADANDADLKQFERWYSQAGTPRVRATTHYSKAKKTLTLTLEQSCSPTPDQPRKLPFQIPFAVGLVGQNGQDLPAHVEGAAQADQPGTVLLSLTEARQSFTFTEVDEEPVVSLLRNFSAPVILDYDCSDEELAHLMAHDSDHFNRWEAGQRLMMRRLLTLTDNAYRGAPMTLDALLVGALRATLLDESLEPAFRDLTLTLPSEAVIAEEMEVVDTQAIHAAHSFMRAGLAQALKREFLTVYESCVMDDPYTPDAVSVGKRSLKNLALSYLLAWPDDSTVQLAQAQLEAADNMTDRMAALSALTHATMPASDKVLDKELDQFYREFSEEALVIDKWFALQAVAPDMDVEGVRELMQHADFTLSNPNRVRSLIFSFCNNNTAQFHAKDGSGYAFWAEQVIALNKINPQVAARLARSLDRWRRFAPQQQAQMQQALQQVAQTEGLSEDVFEVVSKSLAA